MLFIGETSSHPEDMKNRCQSSVDNKCSEVKDERNSREGGNDKVVDEEDVIEAPTKKIKQGGEDSNEDKSEVRNGSENKGGSKTRVIVSPILEQP